MGTKKAGFNDYLHLELCWELWFGAISWIIAFFVWKTGLPGDQKNIPYILFVGPVIGSSLFVATYVLRSLFLSRIHPNSSYPQYPIVPVGTPPALKLDSKIGQFEIADHARQSDLVVGRNASSINTESASNPYVSPQINQASYFQIGRHALPSVCCVCMNATDSSSSYNEPALNPTAVMIPFCASCSFRWKWKRRLTMTFLSLFVAAMTSAVCYFAMFDAIQVGISALAAFILMLCVCSYVITEITRPFKVSVVDQSRGIVKLWFRNQEFQHILQSEIR